MDGLLDYILPFIGVIFVIALAATGAWFAKQYFSGNGMSFFQTRSRRLGLVEITAIDGRHKLMLIRRDNVEHLIMTGGPIDVVIEVGIPVQHRNGLLREEQHYPNDIFSSKPQMTPSSATAYHADDKAAVLMPVLDNTAPNSETDRRDFANLIELGDENQAEKLS